MLHAPVVVKLSRHNLCSYLGFPGGAVVKNLPANAVDTRDADSIPGLGRSPGIGNGNPIQCSCLENFMEEPGGLYSPWITKSRTQLST